MKPLGVFLIIAGILMLIFTDNSFTTGKEIADIGPIEIYKKEKKTISWPSYAGGIIAAISGVVVVLASRKKA